MSTSAQQISPERPPQAIPTNGYSARNHRATHASAGPASKPTAATRPRVFVASHNRLLREALARMLAKSGPVEVVCPEAEGSLDVTALMQSHADILLFVSQGNLAEDLAQVRDVHKLVPTIKILLVGMANDYGEFLQCVRAGIRGYLLRDASVDELLDAIHAMQAGKAVCPGELCVVLFRYFEGDASELPCAAVQRRLGLSRREQQLIPLIAKGFSNKEIANHFCLSEQTIKNHLYRMKHKVGASDRLGIVHQFRTQGFLI
jgi:two-component system response regulator NreC